jgi:hypothetical protein
MPTRSQPPYPEPPREGDSLKSCASQYSLATQQRSDAHCRLRRRLARGIQSGAMPGDSPGMVECALPESRQKSNHWPYFEAGMAAGEGPLRAARDCLAGETGARRATSRILGGARPNRVGCAGSDGGWRSGGGMGWRMDLGRWRREWRARAEVAVKEIRGEGRARDWRQWKWKGGGSVEQERLIFARGERRTDNGESQDWAKVSMKRARVLLRSAQTGCPPPRGIGYFSRLSSPCGCRYSLPRTDARRGRELPAGSSLGHFHETRATPQLSAANSIQIEGQ